MRTLTDNPISDGWLSEHSAGISIRIARRDLWANQPPARQQETLDRVQRLVAEHPQSYLARYWRQIYQ